jgi:quinone-modifying oxidoreductase, subunit QmoB
MTDKLGVFICTCCVGDAVDMDALQSVATSEYKADIYETFDSCGPDGWAGLRERVAAEELTKVVVAGPSNRTVSTADLPTNCHVELVNLADWVVKTHEAGDEDTTMMAEDYLRMGIVRAQRATPVVPFEESTTLDKTILVVGGGVAGLAAAFETAEAGYDVVLVEKAEQLGGYAAKLKQSIPHKPPYRELQDTGIDAKIAAVQGHDKITVHTGTTIQGIEGGPGLFDVTLASGATFRAGAIVQATGFTPVDPTGFEHLGFGKVANVITNDQLEQMAANGGIVKADGTPAKSVAFVQCGDSREKDQFSYASSIMSLNALKQAMYLREGDAESRAYVFYEHIKTPGQHEDFYRRAQEDPGIFLTRGMVSKVDDSSGSLMLDVDDTMLGEQIQVEVDLLVLNSGMKPASADGEAIRKFVDMSAIVADGPENAKFEEATRTVEELKDHDGSQILNLNYRQGPDMPVLAHGYPDSHFICFPYETRRTGIYAAGCLRSPMDGASAAEDAMGAALKAIQAVEMLSRGETVHPRSGDVSFPEFTLSRCTQCKRCTEECPFGAINEDEKGTPEYNVTRCRRCGICLGACPERIINFPDYGIPAVAQMVKAVEVPDEWDEKPRVLVLACENDALPALEAAGDKGIQYSAFVRVIPVRCLGSINVIWIKEAISNGFDGVLMFGCKYGDDYQCHFIKGSELMNTRGANVKETLESMSMENERVQLHQVEITDTEAVTNTIDEFMELIEEIGMNPFKGM